VKKVHFSGIFFQIQVYWLVGGPSGIVGLSCISQGFNLIEMMIDWQASTDFKFHYFYSISLSYRRL